MNPLNQSMSAPTDPIDDGAPSRSPYDETVIPRILLAIGVTFVVAVPATIALASAVSIWQQLWMAFLAANLIVWTAVVLIAALRSTSHGARIFRLVTMRLTRSRRRPRDIAAAGQLAVE